MSRRGKKQPADMVLNMECIDEDLSPAQLAFYCKGEAEFKEISAKLDVLIKNSGAEITEKESEEVYVLQMNLPSATNAPPLAQLSSTPVQTAAAKTNTRQQVPAPNTPMVQSIQIPKSNSLLLQNAPQSVVRAGNTYQLVMDPRSGLIVGVNQPPPLQKTSAPPPKAPAPVQKPPAAPQVKQTTVLKNPPANVVRNVPVRTNPVRTPAKPPTPMVAIPTKGLTTQPQQQAAANRGKGRPPLQPPAAPVNLKPTESNSVGGLIAGGSKMWKPVCPPVVDLTTETRKNVGFAPDSREVVFSKLSGKTFPSLVVVARPYLRVKDLGTAAITLGRTTLDAKVKQVLMFTPTKFTEWLIQQGYVRSEQDCNTHTTSDRAHVKLKLGMYSDVSKFPYSGGYVWISECCPHRFVSVYYGSVFEGAPHAPSVLLKLLYHWSCQTNVQNVAQWVKVDNFYVKNFFCNMRAVCTSAVHEKYEKMGGPRRRVEVGVISLGTTSQDGNMRQVKVEVLGVMEAGTKLVRLRAVEPLADGEKNYKRRFVKILEPLEKWVEKDSVILTDFTVDKGTLHNMGFTQVYQVSPSGDANSASNMKYSNANVMEYLRRIVPRMFQNTLSLLSREIIQQFLDELVWRERWGPIPSQCFENILLHLAEQTKLDASDNFLMRLSLIAADPFKNWSYSTFTSPPPVVAGQSRAAPVLLPQPVVEMRTGIDMLPASIRSVEPPAVKHTAPPNKRGTYRKRQSTEPAPAMTVKRQATETKTSLESYYYATMEGDPNIVKKETKAVGAVKCSVCPRKYTNNLEVMVHLFQHAESEEMIVTAGSPNMFCRYCLKSFPTSWQLTQHIDQSHPRANSVNIMCRICEQAFTERTSLIDHMHRTHTCTELPYECTICTFRSSVHREVVDHFYDTHEGGESLQCPLCLKVVSYNSNGRLVETNLAFFVTHMQKHFRQTALRKCPKCVLAFVHKGMLKDHEGSDHHSLAGKPGVRVFVQTNGSDCIMNVPDAAAASTSGQGSSGGVGTRVRGAHTNSRFHLELHGCSGKCNECGVSLDEPDHFPGLLRCSKCRYMTCCGRTMSDHQRVSHTKTSKAVEVANLPAEMHCVCGYRSRMGNQLAKHMALCERKTAYLSPSCAQMSTRTKPASASFPPLVTLDEPSAEGDLSDRWLKAFNPSRKEDNGDATDGGKKPVASGPPSMLNMLGLVRRPSTEEPPAPEPDKESKRTESSTVPEKGEGNKLEAAKPNENKQPDGDKLEEKETELKEDEIIPVEEAVLDKSDSSNDDMPVDPMPVETSIEPVAEEASLDPVDANETSLVEPVAADEASLVEPVVAEEASLVEPVVAEEASLVEPVVAEEASLGKPVVAEQASLVEPVIAEKALLVEPVVAEEGPLVEPAVIVETVELVKDSGEVLPKEVAADLIGVEEKMDVD